MKSLIREKVTRISKKRKLKNWKSFIALHLCNKHQTAMSKVLSLWFHFKASQLMQQTAILHFYSWKSRAKKCTALFLISHKNFFLWLAMSCFLMGNLMPPNKRKLYNKKKKAFTKTGNYSLLLFSTHIRQCVALLLC